MNQKLPKISKFVKSYRVEQGKDFRLKDVDPADTRGLDVKQEAKELLEKGVARMSDLQQKLTPRTGGLSCSFFRAWTPLGRIVSLSM